MTSAAELSVELFLALEMFGQLGLQLLRCKATIHYLPTWSSENKEDLAAPDTSHPHTIPKAHNVETLQLSARLHVTVCVAVFFMLYFIPYVLFFNCVLLQPNHWNKCCHCGSVEPNEMLCVCFICCNCTFRTLQINISTICTYQYVETS